MKRPCVACRDTCPQATCFVTQALVRGDQFRPGSAPQSGRPRDELSVCSSALLSLTGASMSLRQWRTALEVPCLVMSWTT